MTRWLIDRSLRTRKQGAARCDHIAQTMLGLLLISALALLLATLVSRGWHTFDGSLRAFDGAFLPGLPRCLVVVLVLCVLYFTWR